jgi:hypothetical protein
VIYLCAEGHSGIPRRIQGWLNKNDYAADEVNLFRISDKAIDICKGNIENVTHEINEISKSLCTPVSLIIIDTLTQHMPEGFDENKTVDMSVFLRSIMRLRETQEGCSILIIHHTGHNEPDRGRGSSSLKAALDCELKCDKKKLSFTKMKDAEKPKPISFELLEIIIGHDEDTKKNITSAYVKYTASESETKNGNNVKLREHEKIGIDALSEVIKQLNSNGHVQCQANLEDWREQFYALMIHNNPLIVKNTLKQQFSRQHKGLSSKGIIIIDNGLVILNDSKYLQKKENTSAQPQTVHGT